MAVSSLASRMKRQWRDRRPSTFLHWAVRRMSRERAPGTAAPRICATNGGRGRGFPCVQGPGGPGRKTSSIIPTNSNVCNLRLAPQRVAFRPKYPGYTRELSMTMFSLQTLSHAHKDTSTESRLHRLTAVLRLYLSTPIAMRTVFWFIFLSPPPPSAARSWRSGVNLAQCSAYA